MKDIFECEEPYGDRTASISYWRRMAEAFEQSDTDHLFQIADLQDQVDMLKHDLESAKELIENLRLQLRRHPARSLSAA